MKKYTLDDGTVVTAQDLVDKIGINMSTARTRLSIHSDPEKVFMPKQDNKVVNNGESYKMRQIMSRGMYDPMTCLALKGI